MRGFLKDRISLIRTNGGQVDDIFALVRGNEITIDDVLLKIAEGDKLRRILPNGMDEVYLILNLRYHLGKWKHVKIDVQKETQIDVRKPSYQKININLGNNSQMNVNSSNSPTTMINLTENNLFEKIKQLVNEQMGDEEAKSNLLSQVDELERTKDEKSFSEHYTNFIASAANHATLLTALSPFIPAFMDIIHKSK